MVAVAGLAVAACGDDSSGGAATTAGATTTAGGTATTAGGGSGSSWCADPIDTSLDAKNGTGAGWQKWVVECAAKKPLVATGDAVTIGLQNPEGDPAGTFPEYTKAAQAAVEFINKELGGFGADYKAGKPGRPVKLEVCKMAINPADSTKCANELAAKKPFAVYSTLNFFGNHFPIYQQAKIPVLVGTPITVADFTGEGVFAIGGGGGCLGVHTGLIELATNNLKAKRVAVPWSDTPPGVFCYHDLEKKPLRILAGKVDGDAAVKGKIPGLEDIGVPIKPATPDVTPQVQQVLDFKPDVIVYSAQGADCWTFVNTATKLGWTPAKTPLVLSGACIDLNKIKEAGDSAKGIYFVGATPITTPQDLPAGLLKDQATVYVDKMKKYGAAEEFTKGFATQGFLGMMLMHAVANDLANGDPAKLTGEAFLTAMKATKNRHAFAGTPISCADTDSTYKAVCNSTVTATQWDGSKYNVIREGFSGVYLVKNSKIDTGQG